MALIVGITGGIGSGKSTVCKIFKILNIPVFEADLTARELLDNNKIKQLLFDIFGVTVFNPDRTVNRQKLADLVFNDNNKLNQLNSIIHPAVREEFILWADKMKNLPYIILEAAILFESGFDKLTDYTILVAAPVHQKIERVMRRDGINEEKVRARMKNQLPEEEIRKHADYILFNDNTKLIIPEIIEIDNNLKSYGKIR